MSIAHRKIGQEKRREREKAQITNIRNERGDISENSTDVKKNEGTL